MVHGENLLLNDGSFLLLNDGTALLLNGGVEGVHPVNDHATQKVFPKKRLVNVEFKFWLKANLLEKVIIQLHSIENRISRKGVLSKKPKALTKSLKQTVMKLTKTELTETVKDYKDSLLYDILGNPRVSAMLLLKLLKRVKQN